MTKFLDKHPYWSITIMWIAIYLAHLGYLYPNIMEARNFITAREMLTDGNWILTTMDGLARYEKPPLPTWLTAFFGEIFGMDSITALRLPAALVTLLLLFYMFSLSRKLTQNKSLSLLTSLIAGTSFYIIFAGRNGTWDIFAHAFMLVGIYYLFSFFYDQEKKYRNALLAGLLIGLSFMSKGPVSHYALLLPFLIAYIFTYKFNTFKNKWLPLTLMIIVIAALSSWWAIYIYAYDTAEATRIATKESGRWVGYELKPFYYYWSFFTQSGIWTIPAFVALFYPYLKKKVSNPKVYRFVLLWTVFSVILLSLIPTKKSRYLLPVLIPLAMTTAFYIEYLILNFKNITSKWEKWPVYFNFGLIGTIGVLFPLGAYLYFGDKLSDYLGYFVVTSVALVAVGVSIWFHLLKQHLGKVFHLTIAFIMVVIICGFPLSGALLGNPDFNSVSHLSDRQVPVYTIDKLAPEIYWDYGSITTHATIEELSEMDRPKIQILTNFTEDKDRLDSLKSDYTIQSVETFDLNPLDSSRSSYKNRLRAHLYTLMKR
ncbi:4-amino-4-deoxy-L-arabinose transferase [Nonlabens sp. Hel1_33_55]|uniref:ArnT family glycosyltransferase n=1 Tax=Nonlabens sp. Hel1_33_55 TaxID=1336802 RepID=UPI000875ED8F|nr:glycosyltransferase family 39 protein [Nonlabens sp. Hel1_33_55]SCY09044.1 4-amino-4-deoxy-L-arabinose transferase [Nonlabens sp. Hel1_33_55]